ncbi:MAG: thioredoxin domain-containing protein [Bdellovibrionales bacterium]
MARFIGAAVLIAVLVGGVLFGAGQAAVPEYEAISAQDFVDYVSRKPPGKKIVFLYASWCGPCKALMPKMVALEAAHPNTISVLSVDRNPRALMRYVGGYERFPFRNFVLKGKMDAAFTQTMRQLGVEFPRTVPHVALIEPNGHVLYQGMLPYQTIKSFVQYQY